MRAALTTWLTPFLEAAAAFVAVFICLAGWRRDFHVPISFSYDALEYLMQVKGTIENGWWWVHPRLSAPGVFEQIQYPSNTNVDQAIVWLFHWFTRDAALTTNLAWMAMVAVSAPIASWCAGLLGIERRVAIPIGLLFALSPYALSRNIDHFSLAIYLVPFGATTALLIASGRFADRSRFQRRMLIAGCILLGFNYVYYAFFACFLLLVASLIAVAIGDRRGCVSGLGVLIVICVATAINLAPSMYAWAAHGKPSVIPEKHASEAEQYGLKIRQLVSPAVDYSFGPFRHWEDLERDAQFPLETENRNARLGLVGTAGFLLLLAGFFVPRLTIALGDVFENAGRLTLATLLLATVGGFGSLFNLLVTPEIRSYNRVAPFIALFSLVAIALVVQRWLARSPEGPRKAWIPLALVAALVLGLIDQAQAANSLNEEQERIREEWAQLNGFVHALEARMPPGAMVFQLPVVEYQSETGREAMLANDLIKPYIVSSHIHWSFPALSDPVVHWQEQVSRLPPPVMVSALLHQGFSGLFLDRNGYPDRGQALLTALGLATSPAGIVAQNARYIALDLHTVMHADVPAERLPLLGATMTAATTGVPACGSTSAHNLEWIGGASAPFTKTPIHVSRRDEFSVVGWAVDERAHNVAADVDVVIDDRPYPSSYGIDRSDVSSYFAAPAYRGSGFRARLKGADISPGVHALSLRVLASDRSCVYESEKVQIDVK